MNFNSFCIGKLWFLLVDLLSVLELSQEMHTPYYRFQNSTLYNRNVALRYYPFRSSPMIIGRILRIILYPSF